MCEINHWWDRVHKWGSELTQSSPWLLQQWRVSAPLQTAGNSLLQSLLGPCPCHSWHPRQNWSLACPCWLHTLSWEEAARIKTFQPSWEASMLHPGLHCSMWLRHKNTEKDLNSPADKALQHSKFRTLLLPPTAAVPRLAENTQKTRGTASYQSTGLGQQNTPWHLSNTGGNPHFQITHLFIV